MIRPVLVASIALAAQGALAQALTPVWQGRWQPAQSSVPAAVVRGLHIATQGAVTRDTEAEPPCELRYDGVVQHAAMLAQLRSARDWQLRAEHWPPGTDPATLVGLRREFDDAEELLRTIQPDTYRRVRAKGGACDTGDDVFYILHAGQRLFRLRFPAEGLGVEVTLFSRSPT